MHIEKDIEFYDLSTGGTHSERPTGASNPTPLIRQRRKPVKRLSLAQGRRLLLKSAKRSVPKAIYYLLPEDCLHYIINIKDWV